MLQSCISPRDRSIREWEKYEWKIAKVDSNDMPSWIIYKRKLIGTTIQEYKIQGNINSNPSACLIAFKRSLHNQTQESMRKKYPTYDITEESRNTILTYVIHDEPFPLKDTEMSVRYLFFSNENGSAGVKWHEAWEDCPIKPTSKLKRIETFRGSWDFTPISNNSCQGLKTVQFDPKGMPRWLWELMVFKFLRDGLYEIKNNSDTSEI